VKFAVNSALIVYLYPDFHRPLAFTSQQISWNCWLRCSVSPGEVAMLSFYDIYSILSAPWSVTHPRVSELLVWRFFNMLDGNHNDQSIIYKKLTKKKAVFNAKAYPLAGISKVND
jgi:hypothetical protein